MHRSPVAFGYDTAIQWFWRDRVFRMALEDVGQLGGAATDLTFLSLEVLYYLLLVDVV